MEKEFIFLAKSPRKQSWEDTNLYQLSTKVKVISTHHGSTLNIFLVSELDRAFPGENGVLSLNLSLP